MFDCLTRGSVSADDAQLGGEAEGAVRGFFGGRRQQRQRAHLVVFRLDAFEDEPRRRRRGAHHLLHYVHLDHSTLRPTASQAHLRSIEAHIEPTRVSFSSKSAKKNYARHKIGQSTDSSTQMQRPESDTSLYFVAEPERDL